MQEEIDKNEKQASEKMAAKTKHDKKGRKTEIEQKKSSTTR